MYKKIVMLIFGLFLVMTYLAVDAAAMPQEMMRHARFGIMLAEKNLFPAFILLKHKDDIGLTADQVSKIEKMQVQYNESIIKKQAEIDIQELKLNTYLKEEQIDRSKMEGMIREIGNMKTDLQVQHIGQLLDLRDILTTEQLTKLEELKEKQLMEKRKMRMKERFGRK